MAKASTATTATTARAGTLRVRQSSGLSPAAKELLSKFKTIKHHEELAILRRAKSQDVEDVGVKKDARARAIDIIRARRAQEEAAAQQEKQGQEKAAPKVAPKTKIKLAAIKPVKPTKRKNNIIDDSDDDDDDAKAAVAATTTTTPTTTTATVPTATKPVPAKKRHVIGVKRRAPKPKQIPTIFVEDLPETVGENELMQYFGVQCQLQVTGIHVFDGCMSAIVSFSTPEQGQMVLANAPGMAIGDRPLCVRWATEEDVKASEGVPVPVTMDAAPSDPRMMMAAKVAQRKDQRDEAMGVGRRDGEEEEEEEEEREEEDDDDDDPRARNVVDYFDL